MQGVASQIASLSLRSNWLFGLKFHSWYWLKVGIPLQKTSLATLRRVRILGSLIDSMFAVNVGGLVHATLQYLKGILSG